MPSSLFLKEHAKLAIDRKFEPVDRSEYLDYMTFQANGRPLFTEIFGPLVGLKEEWAKQGATTKELDFSCFRYRDALKAYVPVNLGWLGGPEERILEENDNFLIGLDRMGRKVKLSKNVATLPLPMDYPVKNMDDWLKIKSHYEFSEDRFEKNWEKTARKHLESGRVLCINIPGGFDEPRQLMGEEQLCVSFYTQPELIHDILQTIGDMVVKALDRVTQIVSIDQLDVHEDMAGKSGPLAGPVQVEEFMKPYYRRVWDMLQEKGTRVFFADSDGDVNAILDALIDCGLNAIGPMEPAANMDIVKCREKYKNKIAFLGGIDKHVIRGSQEDIVAELEYKIPPMVKTGGCVLGLDHRIPNGTPLANYHFYIKKIWEIFELETKL